MLRLVLGLSLQVVPGQVSHLAYFLIPLYRVTDLHEVPGQGVVEVGTSPAPVNQDNADGLAEGGGRHADGAAVGCKPALPVARSENRSLAGQFLPEQ